MVKSRLLQRLRNPVCWGSLLLNAVLIAGLLIGPHHFLPGPPPPGKPDQMLGFIGRDLNEADRAIYNAMIDDRRDALRRASHEVFLAIHGIGGTMADEPFDAERSAAAFAQFKAARNAMDDLMSAFMLDAAAAVSPAGRRQLDFDPPG